ncbi:MAG: hypothetical protein KF729_23700 [Sandaracinaceae bacterium]|nr:hypothetical protein [Sandaracinaceae bacterium]
MRDRWLGSLTVLLFVPAVMGFRACEGDVDLGGDRDGGAVDAGPAYDPCGALSCGDACRECPPGDRDCFETEVLKYCQADGRCAPTTPACGPVPYEPCAGLACGAECTLCAPGDTDCVETGVVKYCQPDGACQPTTPSCEPPPPYEPCAGRSCGDGCTLCAPGDTDCVETAVLKYCQPDGRCDATVPACEAGACQVGGCSSQLCVEEGDGGASTCEWRDEYACFRSATCARQADGACGWTDTPELRACLAGGGGPGPDGCRVGGCSGQLCLEEGDHGISTCEWREEYACFRSATCARQADGACGWTETPELRACLGG